MSRLLACLLFVSSIASGAVVHVGGVATSDASASQPSLSVTYTPHAIGDVIVIGADCAPSGDGPTSATFTSSGWTINNTIPVFGSVFTYMAAAQAYAPSTSSSTLTVTFNKNCTWLNVFVAEFSGMDTSTPIDVTATSNSSGTPTVSITPTVDNDAIWVACDDDITGVGSGYTQSSTDGQGDMAEYKILTGGAGVAQHPTFVGSGAYGCVAMAIKPPSAAPASVIIGRAWIE